MWSVLLHYSNKLDTTKSLCCLSVCLSAPPWGHFSLPLNSSSSDLLGIHERSHCLSLWALWKPCGLVPLVHVPISHDRISLKSWRPFQTADPNHLTMELHQKWEDLHLRFLSFCSTFHPQKDSSFQGRASFLEGPTGEVTETKQWDFRFLPRRPWIYMKSGQQRWAESIQKEVAQHIVSDILQPVVNNKNPRSFLLRGPVGKSLSAGCW